MKLFCSTPWNFSRAVCSGGSIHWCTWNIRKTICHCTVSNFCLCSYKQTKSAYSYTAYLERLLVYCHDFEAYTCHVDCVLPDVAGNVMLGIAPGLSNNLLACPYWTIVQFRKSLLSKCWLQTTEVFVDTFQFVLVVRTNTSHLWTRCGNLGNICVLEFALELRHPPTTQYFGIFRSELKSNHTCIFLLSWTYNVH